LVETVTVRAETVTDDIMGYGTARADRAVILSAEVSASVRRLVPRVEPDPTGSGELLEIELEEGVEVRAGQLLIELDDRQYQEELTRATRMAAADTAQLEQLGVEEANIRKLAVIADAETKIARDEVNRLSDLFESGQAGKREFDLARMVWHRADRDGQSLRNQLALLGPRRAQIEASRAARQAETALARLNIERCRILSPFAAWVDSLDVEAGEQVQFGSQLMRLVALDRIEVPIELPISARTRARPDANCRLELESLSRVGWPGKVTRLSPSVDQRSRTFRAYVEVDNTGRSPSDALLPGTYVSAVVQGPTLRDALLVPRTAVVGSNKIYILNGASAHARSVEIQRFIQDRAVLTGEIQDGDRVIVSNLDRLADGMPVLTESSVTDSRPSATEVARDVGEK
jgi:multidrug efflux pump subunit AcrA (membrane-fusion protein)